MPCMLCGTTKPSVTDQGCAVTPPAERVLCNMGGGCNEEVLMWPGERLGRRKVSGLKWCVWRAVNSPRFTVNVTSI